jgi:hypothetical protein
LSNVVAPQAAAAAAAAAAGAQTAAAAIHAATADSVESMMPRSSETFMRPAQTVAIARAARRTAWWNLMLSRVIIGLPDGGSPGTELI